MEILVADPKFRAIANVAEAAPIFRPRSIEIQRVALVILDAQPVRALVVGAKNIVDDFRADAKLQTACRTIPLGMRRKWMRTIVRGFHMRTSSKREEHAMISRSRQLFSGRCLAS